VGNGGFAVAHAYLVLPVVAGHASGRNDIIAFFSLEQSEEERGSRPALILRSERSERLEG
jgi:hypothetical protein